MPMKKKLPSLGIKTHDARKKDEECVAELNSVEQQRKSARGSLVGNGKRNKMAMKQPKCVPKLKENGTMQCALKHVDDETNSVAMEQCKGTVKRVGDSTNLCNAIGSGPMLYEKGGTVEIEWHADEDKGEKITHSIEEIKKSLFNSYEESA